MPGISRQDELRAAHAEGRRRAVPRLLNILAGSVVHDIWEAQWLLGQLGGPTAYKGAVRILTGCFGEESRTAAAHLLHWLFNVEAVPVLCQVVQDRSESPRLRGQALESLGGLMMHADRRTRFYRQATKAVLSSLEDFYPEVRFWAAYAASCMRCRRALPLLEQLSTSDPGLCPGWWSVADEAKDAIAAIRTGKWPELERSQCRTT